MLWLQSSTSGSTIGTIRMAEATFTESDMNLVQMTFNTHAHLGADAVKAALEREGLVNVKVSLSPPSVECTLTGSISCVVINGTIDV